MRHEPSQETNTIRRMDGSTAFWGREIGRYTTCIHPSLLCLPSEANVICARGDGTARRHVIERVIRRCFLNAEHNRGLLVVFDTKGRTFWHLKKKNHTQHRSMQQWPSLDSPNVHSDQPLATIKEQTRSPTDPPPSTNFTSGLGNGMYSLPSSPHVQQATHTHGRVDGDRKVQAAGKKHRIGTLNLIP